MAPSSAAGAAVEEYRVYVQPAFGEKIPDGSVAGGPVAAFALEGSDEHRVHRGVQVVAYLERYADGFGKGRGDVPGDLIVVFVDRWAEHSLLAPTVDLDSLVFQQGGKEVSRGYGRVGEPSDPDR